MARLELKNVSKISLGDVEAVNNVNLEVQGGEFVVLAGPPGCGKSVILRMIAGLENTSKGEIYINGSPVNRMLPIDRGTGMVFQDCALYPRMSAWENMSFGLSLKGFSREEIKRRVEKTSSLLGIEDLLEKKPEELTEMQKRLVGMGRAMVREPVVLLFDNVLNDLGHGEKTKMRSEITSLHTNLRSTIIYATGDQADAMALGNRVAIMKDGFIQQMDVPLNLHEKPANKFVAGFVGSTPMNFISGKLAMKDDHIFFFEGKFEVRVADEMVPHLSDYTGQEIIFGIRPEDIYDKLIAGQSSPDNTIKVRVEVIEPAGSQALLSLNTGLNKLTASVDVHTQASTGQELEFVFDMDKVHFFDRDSEEIIV